MVIQEKLFDITYQNNIPILCTFELNKTCNLRCVHCYIDNKNHSKPLSTPEIKNALKVIAESGVLYLVFTGGEIFLRDDIVELCAYARKLKFDLRLFTNATLLDEKNIKKLSKLNLSAVEISFYGRKQIHDGITGMKGSFDMSLNALQLLKRYGIKITLKTPVIRQNIGEISWLKKFSKKIGATFKLDPVITAKDSGDKTNLKYRLKTRQLARVLETPIINQGKPDVFSEAGGAFCSAGKNLIGISSSGTIYPCLAWHVPLGNIKKLRKLNWNTQKVKKIRNLKTSQVLKCKSCKIIRFCQRCPGMAMNEEGSFLKPSKIACKIASIYKKHFKSISCA